VTTDPLQDVLAAAALPADAVGLLEGLASTRAIRRYRDEPVPPEALRAMLFAATRAPSGSNRQPFRFIVLTDGPKAEQAKALIAEAAQRIWTNKRSNDGYDRGSGNVDNSPKARMAATMQRYTDDFARVPVLVLPCLVRYREPTSFEGASIYPACQNLLLAARALGYGGVLTGFHGMVEPALRELLEVPEGVFMAATITIGKPEGGHGPVRRRPLGELVYGEGWEVVPEWAVDPAGTTHTQAGPPKDTRPMGAGPRGATDAQ
jgi:nitroreductase